MTDPNLGTDSPTLGSIELPPVTHEMTIGGLTFALPGDPPSRFHAWVMRWALGIKVRRVGGPLP